MKKAKDFLDYELQDDKTEFGGVAFVGETLKDFIEEVGLSIDNDIKSINVALKECGIKPIDVVKYLALEYAEKYGIIEYKVVGNEMIYYKTYPMEHTTYKCVVDLKLGYEKRIALNRYYKPYGYIGKVQVLKG